MVNNTAAASYKVVYNGFMKCQLSYSHIVNKLRSTYGMYGMLAQYYMLIKLRYHYKNCPHYSGQIEAKHCSMIIPNQNTQTTDSNSVIEVIGSYRVYSDVQMSNVHVVSITMSKYPAKSFANLNRCDTCIKGQVGLD